MNKTERMLKGLGFVKVSEATAKLRRSRSEVTKTMWKADDPTGYPVTVTVVQKDSEPPVATVQPGSRFERVAETLEELKLEMKAHYFAFDEEEQEEQR